MNATRTAAAIALTTASLACAGGTRPAEPPPPPSGPSPEMQAFLDSNRLDITPAKREERQRADAAWDLEKQQRADRARLLREAAVASHGLDDQRAAMRADDDARARAD